VTVNGDAGTPSRKLRAGDVVVWAPPAPTPTEIAAEALPLAIVHEDRYLVVIDKPAGLVVHPAPGHEAGTLVNALLAHCRDLRGIGGELRPGIVHRLDRDTSGVLLVAKTDRAHQLLSRQMRQRTLRKEYLALVAGIPRVRKGEVTLSVGRDPRDRKKMKAFRPLDENAPAGARTARTLYEIEREWPSLGLTLLRCQLVTGRTHQIRVHLNSIGHPIVGDSLYGGIHRRVSRELRAVQRLERPFLHSARLSFTHPGDGRRVEFDSPLPLDLQSVIDDIEERSAPPESD
jgi:23S rRNA pseudouridine1911/1915/1917 synthase